MEKLSRRSFFKAAGTAAAALGAQAHGLTSAAEPTAAERGGAASTASTAPTAYMFFQPDEARFIEAATERLIPEDQNGPGALAAGVPNISTASWPAPGAPASVSTVPVRGRRGAGTGLSVALHACRAVSQCAARHTRGCAARRKTSFDKLPVAEQDAYLESLQKGRQDLHGVPAHVFFESLLG
jgi:gluconate 2-dehydrogenase gamma chain